MTRLLSPRWNFMAIPERTMRHYLDDAGIPTVDVSTLTPPLRAAYMSRVYVRRKPECYGGPADKQPERDDYRLCYTKDRH